MQDQLCQPTGKQGEVLSASEATTRNLIQTYQTHLDGKSHKKKVTQQKSGVATAKSNSAFYCELCDVLCSNKDGLEAHMRGAKHNKVVNLHRKMGKPIPVPKTSTSSASGSQKTVMVTAPRFVLPQPSPSLLMILLSQL